MALKSYLHKHLFIYLMLLSKATYNCYICQRSHTPGAIRG